MSSFNIQKYLTCYESLKFWNEKSKPTHDYYKENIQKLQTLGFEPPPQHQGIPSEENYAKQLFASIGEIIKNHKIDTDLKDELISIQNLNLIIKVIREACLFGLTLYLPDAMKILRLSVPIKIENISSDDRRKFLSNGFDSLQNVFEQKSLAAHSGLESAQLELLFVAFYLQDNEKIQKCQLMFSREQIFRHLMLLKGLKCEESISKLLHKKLLEDLSMPGGVELLCRLLIKTTEPWKVGQLVAQICAAKGHSAEFYSKIIEEVFKLLKISVFIRDQETFEPICVNCIKELHKIPQNSQTIEDILVKWLMELENTTLKGAIVYDANEYQTFLQMTCACFGGNSINLPSEVVSPYISQLFKLYSLSSAEDKVSKTALESILNHILKNSNKLLEIVEEMFTENETKLSLNYTKDALTPSVVVGTLQKVQTNFISFLKNSGNTILMYDVLLILLKMFVAEIDDNRGDLIDEDDLAEFISRKFKKKLLVIESLQDLINFKPLHGQFKENPTPILEFLDNLLESTLNKTTFDIESVQLLLTIICEVLPDQEKFQKILQKHEKLPKEVKENIQLLNSGPKNQFSDALLLLSRLEPHLKVNGTMQLIELIKKNDPETCTNKFKILAIAIQNLKDVESYAYLNTIRLLVALTALIEAEVIENLLAEFKNDQNDVDFRLKVAEVIIKVIESLGQMAYKYKKELFDCFLSGCTVNKDELRASSFAKLGVICRILTFQVHHFFNEMLTVVHQTLQLDDFKPSRRSAVMLLNQLLEGVENILDFQEILLPVYRTLKEVIATETDEVTRLQAALSMETLNKITKEFLNPEQRVQLDLKIEGVKEKSTIDIKYK